jgi:hypothetical protein
MNIRHSHWFHVGAVLLALVALGLTCQRGEATKKDLIKDPRRFQFKIEPNTPVKDLLPTPPKTLSVLPPVANQDLTLVPELTFSEPVKGDTEKETAHVIAKITHLNQHDDDGFLKAFLAARADMRGLPFLMGKDCRTETKRSQVFSEAVNIVHRSENHMHNDSFVVPDDYWQIFMRNWVEADGKHAKEASREEIERSKVAALMQVFGPTRAPYRAGLARFLADIPHADATRALARLAIFSPEDSVRMAAIDSLKSRDAQLTTSILVEGFRHPLPAVSKRAAEALVKLKYTDTIARLVDVLDRPDPRAPLQQKIDGKETTVVRELVRVNHHRNCLLCHAPANSGTTPRDVLAVPVPLPDRSLLSSGYGSDASPDIFVRTDVTYLRQDFSVMMKVEDAKPWPEMQRFDFLVRTREVNADEAAKCRNELAKLGTPPAHAAAHYALRELTGHNNPNGMTAAAWREALKLP